MVGTAGFEPATPCTQNRCATKLRHVPNCPLHSKQLCGRAPGNCLSLGEIAASRGVSLIIGIQHHCGARNRAFAAPHLVYSFGPERFIARARECSSMVEPQPSKLLTRVRFPSLAPSTFLSIQATNTHYVNSARCAKNAKVLNLVHKLASFWP